MLTASFIGCGRLGKTIARLCYEHKLLTVNAILNSTLASSKVAAAFVGQGKACASVNDIPKSDLYFITTNDGNIAWLCDLLITHHQADQQAIFIHCSGALTSSSLESASKAGHEVVSIHPVKSFADPKQAVQTFKGTLCSVEGDAHAVAVVTKLFIRMGAEVFAISKENKIRCHAAMSMSNNYLVALHYQAMQLFMSAGIEESIAKRLVSGLMRDALNNTDSLPHAKALTGPIQRGDVATISGHLDALKDNELALSVYRILGQATLPLTAHSEDIKKQIALLLL